MLNTLIPAVGKLIVAGSIAGAMMLGHPMAGAGAMQEITEDSPAWDCTTMGNRVCGPQSVGGGIAGCYDDGGSIVALWPCHVEVNPDGSADVYDDASYDSALSAYSAQLLITELGE